MIHQVGVICCVQHGVLRRFCRPFRLVKVLAQPFTLLGNTSRLGRASSTLTFVFVKNAESRGQNRRLGSLSYGALGPH